MRTCTGMADHIVFVFNVMQPPPTIKPGKLEPPEDVIRLSKLSFSEAKGLRLVCGNPSQKCASLCWESVFPCSVGGLWLSWGSMCVSSYCLVVGVYSVVAVNVLSNSPFMHLSPLVFSSTFLPVLLLFLFIYLVYCIVL